MATFDYACLDVLTGCKPKSEYKSFRLKDQVKGVKFTETLKGSWAFCGIKSTSCADLEKCEIIQSLQAQVKDLTERLARLETPQTGPISR